MLTSTKLQRRQSEIRQELATLAANDNPSEDEQRSMDVLDKEYRTNETRFRAALVAEDAERREMGAELETREDRDFAWLMQRFELRQVALHLDEGRQLDGATAEVVSELRSQGGFRGVPVPLAALETRANETVAANVPDPMRTAPIVDRLFADSVASQMGVQTVNVGTGALEYPVVTSSIAAGWVTELGTAPVAQYTTADRTLRPNNELAVQTKITRRSLKQAGSGLEQAIRRDMAGTMREELDRAVFLGAGTGGAPLGIFPGAGTYGITSTAVGGTATWAGVRAAVVDFMLANAASAPGGVNLMLRPEVWDSADDLISGLGISEWDRIREKVGRIVLTSNALADPTGSPGASSGLLTTAAGGTPPAFVGLWGAVDMVRDPFTEAAKGLLVLTGYLTADVTVARGSQLQILTGLE